MRRRLVALAPLLTAVLLVQVVLTCRPTDAAPAGTTATAGPASAPHPVPDGEGRQSSRALADQPCAGTLCGSLTRSGRSGHSTDRRDQVAQQAPVVPDGSPHRHDPTDRRPRTVDTALDHIFLGVLRC